MCELVGMTKPKTLRSVKSHFNMIMTHYCCQRFGLGPFTTPSFGSLKVESMPAAAEAAAPF